MIKYWQIFPITRGRQTRWVTNSETKQTNKRKFRPYCHGFCQTIVPVTGKVNMSTNQHMS